MEMYIGGLTTPPPRCVRTKSKAPMGLGQYNSLGEYWGPHTASSMLLILLVFCLNILKTLRHSSSEMRCSCLLIPFSFLVKNVVKTSYEDIRNNSCRLVNVLVTSSLPDNIIIFELALYFPQFALCLQ